MPQTPENFGWVRLTQGCQFVHNQTAGILVGCVSEAIKYLAQHKLTSIKLAAIVLSDTAHAHGVSNWALEFPVYKNLFIDSGLQTGRKLAIIGSKKQIARAKAILRTTLLGPTRSQYRKWAREYGVPGSHYRMIMRACDAFALKKNGAVLQLEDVIEFIPYDNDRNATLPPFHIQHRGEDVFKITDSTGAWHTHCQLTFTTKPAPPFSIQATAGVRKAHRFAFRVLLNSNGFDHLNGCTAYIIWIDGQPFIWDAAPFVNESLRASGLSIDEVAGVIITHTHDDHSSLLELMAAGRRIRLYATPEVFEGLLIKIGAIIDRNLQLAEHRTSFLQLIDFHPITCGVPVQIGSACFTAHYNIHSIPTIGGRITYDDGAKVHQLLISGDTAGPAKLREFERQKLISQRWIDETRARITGTEDLVIHDGGADAAGLHANPEDPELLELAKTMNERLYFGHRSSQLLANGQRINVAAAGFEKVFLPKEGPEDDLNALEIALATYDMHAPKLVRTLFEVGESVSVAGKQVIIRQGDPTNCVYVLIAGQLAIEIDQRPVAILGKGSIFGEMAALTDQKRSATVKSISAARLFRIPQQAFIRLADTCALLDKLKTLWSKREQLMHTCIFNCLPNKTIANLTQTLAEIHIDVGTPILKQGELSNAAYIIVKGQVSVVRDERVIAYLGPGNIFGEKAALDHAPTPRTATVKALTACQLLKIEGAQLRHLNQDFFLVNDLLYTTLQKRDLLK